MTETSKPAPLVSAEVDLRDFAFMPLDVQRLRDSDLTSDETPEACWAAVLLWCASWHQVPAASIPASDQWQAKQCGYVAQGRASPAWKRVRKGALRGWVECSDGRLYHPVVAEKALDAWRSKLLQRWKTEASRVKKHNQRHDLQGSSAVQMPDFERWIDMGCPQGHALPVPGDKPPTSPGTGDGSPREVPRETPSKGQGQGQGQEEIHNPLTLPAARDGSELPGGDQPPEDPPDPADPTPAGRLGMAMREVGLHPSRINAHDPVALALLERGVSVEQFAEAVRDAMGKRRGDPWRYALTVLERRVAQAAEIAAAPAAAPDPDAWRKTFDGVQRRAAELGVKPRTGEMAADFERRVLTAHQRAASTAQGAPA